jgi:hypothetical protein
MWKIGNFCVPNLIKVTEMIRIIKSQILMGLARKNMKTYSLAVPAMTFTTQLRKKGRLNGEIPYALVR